MKFFNALFFIGMVTFLLVTNLFAQWEPDVRLTYDDSLSRTSHNNAWCIAANGDTVHVVWYDMRDGNWEIYYKRSTDQGTTWGSDTRLTNATAQSANPSIAVSGYYVHLVWVDDRDGNGRIYYKRSTNGGTVWETDVCLAYDPDGSWSPSIAVSGLDVHVVWHNYDPPDIYYKHSTNGGTTWSSDTRLTNNPADAQFPSIAISGNTIHVVWHDGRYGNWDIYYKRSTNNGTSWGADIRLTDNLDWSYSPCVAVSADNVHVVWRDDRDGNWEIYYKRSTDEGSTWETEIRLTNAPDWSRLPSVAVLGSIIVHTIWQDDRDGDNEIYYNRSTNGGTTWETDTRLTDDPGWSYTPSVAVSGSNVHVVWADDRDGNSEIYYKRNPTGNAVAEEDLRRKTTDLRLHCHPNPFTDKVNIKLGMYDGKPKMDDFFLEIYDVSGRLVKAVPLTTNYLSLTTDFKAGVYFLKMEGYELVKVVKLR